MVPPGLLAQARPVDEAVLERESVVVVRVDEASVARLQLVGGGSIELGAAARLAPPAAAATAATATAAAATAAAATAAATAAAASTC